MNGLLYTYIYTHAYAHILVKDILWHISTRIYVHFMLHIFSLKGIFYAAYPTYIHILQGIFYATYLRLERHFFCYLFTSWKEFFLLPIHILKGIFFATYSHLERHFVSIHILKGILYLFTSWEVFLLPIHILKGIFFVIYPTYIHIFFWKAFLCHLSNMYTFIFARHFYATHLTYIHSWKASFMLPNIHTHYWKAFFMLPNQHTYTLLKGNFHAT